MSRFVLPQERQREILRRLADEGRVLAADLSREFGTSEDTIRRDLRELAQAGRCERVHGGAVPLTPISQDLRQRLTEAPGRKSALARTAAKLARPGNTIFIDTGSTNLAIARALPEDMRLTVATNAPAVAAALAERSGIEVVLLGGRLNRSLGGACGVATVEAVRGVRADLYFIGTCAFDAELGLADFDCEEALLKRAMIEASVATAVVVLREKLGTRAPFLVAEAAAVRHLVVEHGSPENLTAPFAALGVNVHVAGAASDD